MRDQAAGVPDPASTSREMLRTYRAFQRVQGLSSGQGKALSQSAGEGVAGREEGVLVDAACG